MDLDLTVTISVIIALCAMISPILVAIINNHHQQKMKQIEIASNHKIHALEEYMSSLEQLLNRPSTNAKMKYGSAFGLALLYVSSARKLMLEIDSELNSNLYNPQIADKIEVLAHKLQKEMGI